MNILIIELGNKSGHVGFVFVTNLNGLATSQLEPDLFNRRVEKV